MAVATVDVPRVNSHLIIPTIANKTNRKKVSAFVCHMRLMQPGEVTSFGRHAQAVLLSLSKLWENSGVRRGL